MHNEIVRILKDHNAFGPDEAITRDWVLDVLQFELTDLGIGVTDRKMRGEIHKGGTILKCEKGYYLPREDHKKEDVQYCVDYLKKKIFPLWKYIKDLETNWPMSGQLDLGFMEEERAD